MKKHPSFYILLWLFTVRDILLYKRWKGVSKNSNSLRKWGYEFYFVKMLCFFHWVFCLFCFKEKLGPCAYLGVKSDLELSCLIWAVIMPHPLYLLEAVDTCSCYLAESCTSFRVQLSCYTLPTWRILFQFGTVHSAHTCILELTS